MPEEIRYGEWFNIWNYQQFYANLFATYAGISDQDATELLYQLQDIGCVQLGRHFCDMLHVKSHSFFFDRKHKSYKHNSRQVRAYRGRRTQDSNFESVSDFTKYRQIWETALYLKIFKIQNILECTEVDLAVIENYLNRLQQLGYFQVLQDLQIQPDDDEKVYRLIKN